MQNPTGKKQIREPDGPKSSEYGPKSDDLVTRGSNRKMAKSQNPRYYPQQQAAAERLMDWMVTQLYSDVDSHQTHSRRAARLSVARLQSAGADSGLETQKSALAPLSVIRTRRLQQQQSVTLWNTLPTKCAHSTCCCHSVVVQSTKTGWLNDAQSARLFAARPEAVSLGSDAAVQRGASLRGARSQRQQLVSAFARISARTINSIFPHTVPGTHEDCFDLRTAQLRKRSGPNLKLKI